jgi:hypothetical protein
MGRPPLNIDVAKKDQYELRTLLKGGVQQVRVVLRALVRIPRDGDQRSELMSITIPK